MKKYLVFMIGLLLLLLVGCHQPAESYHRAVEKLQLSSRLTDLEIKADECSVALNKFVLAENSYSSYQEKKDVQNYEQINISVQEIKQLINQLQTDSSQIHATDDTLIIAHESLVEALDSYNSLIIFMESLLKVSNDLDQKFYDIQTLNNQILELSFSGEPTSDAYRKALSEYMLLNKDKLEFMDLAEVEQLLSATSIDKSQLEVLISQANSCKEGLKSISTLNEIDKATNDLIIQMYQHIASMYEYVLANKLTIENTNKYDSFTVYYEDQKNIINKDLGLWQQALK